MCSTEMFTYIDVLMGRAGREGVVVFVEDGKVSVKDPIG